MTKKSIDDFEHDMEDDCMELDNDCVKVKIDYIKYLISVCNIEIGNSKNSINSLDLAKMQDRRIKALKTYLTECIENMTPIDMSKVDKRDMPIYIMLSKVICFEEIVDTLNGLLPQEVEADEVFAD